MLFVYLAAPEFKLVHLAQQERQEGNPQEADGAHMAAKEDREGNLQKQRQRRSLPVEGEWNSPSPPNRIQIEIQRAFRAAPVAVIMRTV